MSDKPPVLTYGDLTNLEKLYMFEFIFPEAVRAVMSAAQITAYTNFVAPEFQSERPRVGIAFVPGAGQGRWHPVRLRECAWKGAFNLELITAADMAVHGRFVSLVRSLMSGLVSSFNEILPMANHKFQPMIEGGAAFYDGGSSAVLKPEEGYYMTTLNFETNFSIQDNAWALLDS